VSDDTILVAERRARSERCAWACSIPSPCPARQRSARRGFREWTWRCTPTSIATAPLLVDLRWRIRDVKQGRDGLLYRLTDEADAVMLRIEPAE
jgi:glucose/arabinose dehydrogenase